MVSPVIEVTGVRFLPAGPVGECVGVLGHITCVVNGGLVLGLTLRQTRAGRPYVAYPAHPISRGRQRHTVRPRDDAARRAIEAQIFAELRRQGWLEP